MTTPQMDWLDDERRRLRNAAIRDATKRMNQVIDNTPIPEAEKQSVRTDLAAGARNTRRILCGDRVVTPDGWTGRVVAQHGPYSWVSMEATNSPKTWGTSALKPVENDHAE